MEYRSRPSKMKRTESQPQDLIDGQGALSNTMSGGTCWIRNPSKPNRDDLFVVHEREGSKPQVKRDSAEDGHAAHVTIGLSSSASHQIFG